MLSLYILGGLLLVFVLIAFVRTFRACWQDIKRRNSEIVMSCLRDSGVTLYSISSDHHSNGKPHLRHI